MHPRNSVTHERLKEHEGPGARQSWVLIPWQHLPQKSPIWGQEGKKLLEGCCLRRPPWDCQRNCLLLFLDTDGLVSFSVEAAEYRSLELLHLRSPQLLLLPFPAGQGKDETCQCPGNCQHACGSFAQERHVGMMITHHHTHRKRLVRASSRKHSTPHRGKLEQDKGAP